MKTFGPTTGYLWLDSWILANIVQLGTQRFCKKFLRWENDPTGRQFDQMTQAARSGVANIAEGSARHKTSRETEMKLTDVARASLAELSGDYLNWLLQRGKLSWEKSTPDARAVYGIRLDRPDYSDDALHSAAAHILTQKQRFARWLDSDNDTDVANAMLILIAQVINMLNRQMESQSESFQKEGGFREKLSTLRVESRARQQVAPDCPECGKPMVLRKAKTGKRAGSEFWGCSAYPECKGARDPEGENPKPQRGT